MFGVPGGGVESVRHNGGREKRGEPGSEHTKCARLARGV